MALINLYDCPRPKCPGCGLALQAFSRIFTKKQSISYKLDFVVAAKTGRYIWYAVACDECESILSLQLVHRSGTDLRRILDPEFVTVSLQDSIELGASTHAGLLMEGLEER